MDARKARNVGTSNMRRDIDVLRHAVELEEIHAAISDDEESETGAERK